MTLVTKISVQLQQNPTRMSKFHTGPKDRNPLTRSETYQYIHIYIYTYIYTDIYKYNAESYKNVVGVQIDSSHTYCTKCQSKTPTASTGKLPLRRRRRRRSCFCCCCLNKPPGAWREGARLARSDRSSTWKVSNKESWEEDKLDDARKNVGSLEQLSQHFVRRSAARAYGFLMRQRPKRDDDEEEQEAVDLKLKFSPPLAACRTEKLPSCGHLPTFPSPSLSLPAFLPSSFQA